MILWFRKSLARKFAVAVVAGLAVASMVFLVLFIGLYRSQLERERAEASAQVNRLLQASLENAMLKRDLMGLREIVDRLGEQDGIVKVMIINPAGEVRFTSDGSRLGRKFRRTEDPTCVVCHGAGRGGGADTLFMTNEEGREVLRSVNPVRNKAACQTCHGAITGHPVNGVLFVDYDAQPILTQAFRTTLFLVASGGLVLIGLVALAGVLVRHFVLIPVRSLALASDALAGGDMEARVPLRGDDELAHLGRGFNRMADQLRDTLRDVREQQAFTQGLLDADPDGIRVIDEDFTVLSANRAYCDQVGLPFERVVGRPCHASSHASDHRCPPTLVSCPMVEVWKVDGPIKTMQRFVRADGSVLAVEVMSAPVTVSQGGRTRRVMMQSVRDLAKHVKVSHQMRLAEMGKLAAGVAHEIRNPLATIRLTLQRFLRRPEGETPEQVRARLAAVDTQIDRCIDVTERLLKLVMPPSERPQLVEIDACVTETVSLLIHEAEPKGIEVVLDLADDRLRFLGSDSEVRMLIFNLVQNAFHAMPGGGRLSITTRRDGGTIVMSFRDTGVGIPPDILAQVFDPFFSRRADGVEGTGLGLSICQAIVERYHGRIDIESSVDVGSTFRIVLPSAESQMEKPGAA